MGIKKEVTPINLENEKFKSALTAEDYTDEYKELRRKTSFNLSLLSNDKSIWDFSLMQLDKSYAMGFNDGIDDILSDDTAVKAEYNKGLEYGKKIMYNKIRDELERMLDKLCIDDFSDDSRENKTINLADLIDSLDNTFSKYKERKDI